MLEIQTSNETPVQGRSLQTRVSFRVGDNPKNVKVVLGENYNHAATVLARKLYGNGTCARRIFGEFDDMSGYFQAYIVTNSALQKDIGEPFHLQRISSAEYLKNVGTPTKSKQLAKAASAV